MLTISQVAAKYNISYLQVHELIDYGFLNVARVLRNNNRGLIYLFCEQELIGLDFPSLLAEVKELKNKNGGPRNSTSFKKVINTINYYDKFLNDTEEIAGGEVLKISFYLFHLNHYAKTNNENSLELYRIKNQVIQKIYRDNPLDITATYLVGPDKVKVWLCEDCKSSANASRIRYSDYVKKESYCSKCYIQSVEKEYYSLVEFFVELADYRFVFHLPRSSAVKWVNNIDILPQGTRKLERYDDTMYLYGRPVTRIERKLFPISYILTELNDYLHSDVTDCSVEY